ncbi:MAG: AraC family transcriptional regulator [Ruminococcaceae bacterium]|nr:AraC family transcriptional regulator [Oscillospiraceae bacterium]
MISFENCIEEIENNLAGEIDIERLAKMAKLSVYEFRRIFSFVAGLPLSEYIRKRRLSLAIFDLMDTEASITDIAAKYGYDSSSSFSRAFRDFHGISPSDVKKGNCRFNLMTRITAEIVLQGGKDISYSVEDEPEFCIYGICGESNIEDTECCEQVWNQYSDAPEGADRVFAAYQNHGNSVMCYIGSTTPTDNSTSYTIPASRWVKFDRVGTDDAAVNEFYRDVLSGWFRSTGLIRRAKLPNVEVYPADMSEDNFAWQIWIPIENIQE